MASTLPAPTLDKGALPSANPPGGTGAVPSADPSRVVAAIRYGWAIEELVWRLHDWAAHLAPAGAAPSPSSDFPPDLDHQRSPAEYVRELQALFKATGPSFLNNAQIPVGAANVDNRLTQLLQAYEAAGDTTAFLSLTSPTRISASVRLWDADLVDLVIDGPPAVLSAYELGKSLSYTQWQIYVAEAIGSTPGSTADPVANAWQAALNRDRINQMRADLSLLAPSLDAAVVTAASASMGFWRRAYELGQLRGSPLPDKSDLTDPKILIPANDADRLKLRASLEQQLANWYDLLTGHRRLSDFPVTGFVTHLVRQYARREWVVLRPAILSTVGIVVALVLVALLVSFILTGSITAGLTGGLTTLLGLFVARGAGLIDRGSQAVGDLQTRVAHMQAQLSGLIVSAQNQPAQLTFESLAGSALAQIVDQIQLEESKLAISAPLINYVMGPDISTKGPDQIAKDFLTKILQNDGTSNLDRLQSVLAGLLQEYRPLVPGAP